ncbi:MAG TPA: hypothetical protein VGB99_13525 [Acidobacteriota bacterium]|jgi:hypothetical protein
MPPIDEQEAAELRARMEAKRQGLVLRGQVLEAGDGSTPVPGATAVLELFPTVRTLTGVDGSFSFSVHRDYNHKELRLHFEKEGYQREQIDLTFDHGMEPLRILLRPARSAPGLLGRLLGRS